MHTQTYKVKGMHCASCASIIERAVKKIDGVENISVNNGTENAKISFNTEKTSPEMFNQKLEPLGYSLVLQTAEEMGMTENEHAEHLGLNQSKKEKLKEIDNMKKGVFGALPIAGISIFIMAWEIFGKYNLVAPMSNTIYEFFHHLLPIFATYIFITIGKPYLSVQYNFYDVSIVVITFIALGKYLEAKSKLKTGDAIEKLLGLQAKTALVIRDGKEIEIR